LRGSPGIFSLETWDALGGLFGEEGDVLSKWLQLVVERNNNAMIPKSVSVFKTVIHRVSEYLVQVRTLQLKSKKIAFISVQPRQLPDFL
jgi:hypothetical protein